MKFIISLLAFLLIIGPELLAEAKSLDIKDSQLTIKIDREERCVFGDLDAIKYESEERVSKGQLAKVIVTLEALNENKVITKTLLDSADPKSSSSIFDFDLASLPKGPVALFICSDSDGKNSCASKVGANFPEIFARYQFKNDPKTGKAISANPDYLDKNSYPEDKIYFASVLDLGTSISYYNPLLVEDLPALVKPIANPKKSTNLKDLVQSLGSLPLVPAEKGFLVKLPAYDKAKCSN